MTISLFININDIQEFNYLIDNYENINSPFVASKAVIIDCFNAFERISHSNILYTQVNIEYIKFDKIKEYLKWN